MERTLAIIKPDAFRKNLQGKIISRYLQAGLRIVAMKQLQLTKKEAEGFYAVHKNRPFFPELTVFMSAGPSIVLILEGENAIQRNRELMGATDPSKAEPGTLRKDFADNIQENAVHGSDSPDTARFEMGYFFNALEITTGDIGITNKI
jgi:nucleoside-diphosphate kinase